MGKQRRHGKVLQPAAALRAAQSETASETEVETPPSSSEGTAVALVAALATRNDELLGPAQKTLEKLQRHQAYGASKKAKNTQLKDDLHSIHQTLAEMKRQIAGLTTANETKTSQIAGLTTANETKTSQITVLTDEISLVKAENKASKKQTSTMKNQIGKLKKEVKILKKDNADLKRDNQELKAKVDVLGGWSAIVILRTAMEIVARAAYPDMKWSDFVASVRATDPTDPATTISNNDVKRKTTMNKWEWKRMIRVIQSRNEIVHVFVPPTACMEQAVAWFKSSCNQEDSAKFDKDEGEKENPTTFDKLLTCIQNLHTSTQGSVFSD